ncbi:hypothetical protein SAMN05421743_1284 [Thalassobacillus cyri]|uniref:RsgI N-terminal anti-sigma domain-containing protein n=1 Tax=Thalassobacillus cyri TaxID=571932 RepID=A0A1H4HFK5_9BACI|nr:hypothetical protein [Thalassobacillus cyri]SEB20461.1 hypothetical protein SAMN05421743_1284 [Thalassobacillus cyri]
MRKGIVMEHHRGYTIVLTEFGTLLKAKPLNDVEVGMETSFELLPENTGLAALFQWRKQQAQLRIIAIATALLIALFPLYSWYDSNQAYAYVNVDINPSIELEINEDREVLDITPHNDEARELLEDLSDWKHQAAGDVILQIIEFSEQKGLMNDLDSVLVGVSYLKEGIASDFTDEIETYVSKHAATLTVAAFVVPETLRDKAKENKQSVNRYMAETLFDPTSANTDKSSDQVQLEGEDKDVIQSFYNKKQDRKPSQTKENDTTKNKASNIEKVTDPGPPGHEKQKETPVKKKDEHPGKGKGLDKKSSNKKETPSKGNGPPDKVKEKKQQAPGHKKKEKDYSPSRADKQKKDDPSGKTKIPGQQKKDKSSKKQNADPPGQAKKNNKK